MHLIWGYIIGTMLGRAASCGYSSEAEAQDDPKEVSKICKAITYFIGGLFVILTPAAFISQSLFDEGGTRDLVFYVVFIPTVGLVYWFFSGAGVKFREEFKEDFKKNYRQAVLDQENKKKLKQQSAVENKEEKYMKLKQKTIWLKKIEDIKEANRLRDLAKEKTQEEAKNIGKQ